MMRATKTYQDLLFWQNAFEVSRLVIKLVAKLPKSPANKVITYQLLRSAMSVAANIAEGYGRFGQKEYSRYLQVSLGSANETENWLLMLIEANPRYKLKIKSIIRKNKESIKMLAASLKTIRLRKK